MSGAFLSRVSEEFYRYRGRLGMPCPVLRTRIPRYQRLESRPVGRLTRTAYLGRRVRGCRYVDMPRYITILTLESQCQYLSHRVDQRAIYFERGIPAFASGACDPEPFARRSFHVHQLSGWKSTSESLERAHVLLGVFLSRPMEASPLKRIPPLRVGRHVSNSDTPYRNFDLLSWGPHSLGWRSRSLRA